MVSQQQLPVAACRPPAAAAGYGVLFAGARRRAGQNGASAIPAAAAHCQRPRFTSGEPNRPRGQSAPSPPSRLIGSPAIASGGYDTKSPPSLLLGAKIGSGGARNGITGQRMSGGLSYCVWNSYIYRTFLNTRRFPFLACFLLNLFKLPYQFVRFTCDFVYRPLTYTLPHVTMGESH